MAKVKGTVSGCGKGKFSYFVTLQEKDGFYYNTKFEPKCGKGDVVGIEFEQKADNRGNVKKITVLESNSNGYEDTSKSFSEKGGNTQSGVGNKPGGGGDRQNSIIWQHSQEMAISTTHMLVTTDGIKLPPASKPDARRVVIEALVDELTVKFFKDASDPLASKAYSDGAGIEEDAGDGEKEPDGDDAWDEGGEKKEDSGWDDWD